MHYAKTAIITGISGQDGAYLARFLLQHNYKVIGFVRNAKTTSFEGLRFLQIFEQVRIEECDLLDISQIVRLLALHQPDEVYNLAAQSSVSLSFRQPIGTFQFNTLSVYNLLEAIKIVNRQVKFYQASSSEMFGKVHDLPIRETTAFHPLSPYAISKAAAHWTCVNYRESYDMFVCCGILFNHESYLRTANFFVKKVLVESLRIKYGLQTSLFVGNIDIKRDFGYAPLYVESMYAMMQHEVAGDFVICSGGSVSLRSVIEYIFDKLSVSKAALVVSEDLYRPAEILDIYGDPTKARQALGWNYTLSFFQVLDLLLKEEELHFSKQS